MWNDKSHSIFVRLFENNYRGQFHQTFLLSEKLLAHGVWRKNRHSISPIFSAAKFARDVSWNFPNLWAIRWTPFAKKGVESCARKCWWNQPQNIKRMKVKKRHLRIIIGLIMKLKSMSQSYKRHLFLKLVCYFNFYHNKTVAYSNLK